MGASLPLACLSHASFPTRLLPLVSYTPPLLHAWSPSFVHVLERDPVVSPPLDALADVAARVPAGLVEDAGLPLPLCCKRVEYHRLPHLAATCQRKRNLLALLVQKYTYSGKRVEYHRVPHLYMYARIYKYTIHTQTHTNTHIHKGSNTGVSLA